MKTDAHRSRCWVCRARRIAAVLFFLSLLPALARARELQAEPPPEMVLPVEAGGLTADEVARRAVETSPDLEAKLREVDAAAAQVDVVIAAKGQHRVGKCLGQLTWGHTEMYVAAGRLSFVTGHLSLVIGQATNNK